MTTMQLFHTQLFSSSGRNSYLAALLQLTRASRAQLASLNLEWTLWE